MKMNVLHTPEGVRDIYNGECERKIALEDKIFKSLRSFGYHPIQTPSFEFFDVFAKEIGTTPSNELYKFFDREGNTLVLRPDITPSVARVASKFYMDETIPIRFCYKGNTFINNHSYQGRLKETTQLGAELLGDDSPDADAEMIAMVVTCLKEAGLDDFQIGIGHAQFFMGLVKEAKLTEETIDELRLLICNKNFFGVEELISTIPISDDLKKLFGNLEKLYQSADELKKIKESAVSYPMVYEALERLEKLDILLREYQVSRYVSYELGMIANYDYYTGIIFTGYTFGSGEPVVKGGRYDRLLQYFGKDAPAIGFAIVSDQLMAALSRQKIEIKVPFEKELIVYTTSNRTEALSIASTDRANGLSVEMLLYDNKRTKADYEAFRKRSGIDKMLYLV